MMRRQILFTAALLTLPLLIAGHLAFAAFWVVGFFVSSLAKGEGFDSAITASRGYLAVHFIALVLASRFLVLIPAGFVFFQCLGALLSRELPRLWFFATNLISGAALGVACWRVNDILEVGHKTGFNWDQFLAHPFTIFFGSVGLGLGLILSFLIPPLIRKVFPPQPIKGIRDKG
jgi:hypothetical protein